MTELVVFTTGSLGFLGLLMYWASRIVNSKVDAKSLSAVEEALTEVQLELPPRIVGSRIFSDEDWEYIRTHASASIQRMFLDERKTLAISWLREMRRNVALLMKFHRTAVRESVTLSPALEIRLALDYLFFTLTFQVLAVIIRMRGPFSAGRFVSFTVLAADQLSYLSGNILVGLDPSRMGQIKDSWSSRAAAA